MRRVRVLVAAALVAASSVFFGPAADAQPNVLVAVSATFAPLEIVIVEGTGLTFVNLDDVPHDVTADPGQDGTFSSASIGRGATKVNGVETLAPNTYTYFCSTHDTTMFGLITVVGA